MTSLDIDGDPKITFRRNNETISYSDALAFLARTTRKSNIRVVAHTGPDGPGGLYLDAYVLIDPGQPCEIVCHRGNMGADEAETTAILLVTARLLALAVDRRRERAEVRVP